MSVKWIKITTDIFDDEKIRLIDAMPDADSIIVVWFKLLAQAGKSNQNGALFLNNKIAYTDEMLATIFNRKIATVRLALEVFESLNMIERGDYIQVVNWEKHQNIEGLEKIRLQNAERQRRYRERQKQDQLELEEPKEDVTLRVTQRNEVEEDIEEDIDNKEKNNKKEKPKRQSTYNKKYFSNEEVNKLFIEFLELRKKLRAVNSERAINTLINKLKPFSDSVKLKMIENSIVSSWKSVYELKGEQKVKEEHKLPDKFKGVSV